ncbi:MFS transporter [Staphylococcus capitis]|uniref:MFS transporter n=1 Tax=Staphylococcus capitis TaxID=29388 RepID=A0A7Z7YU10_STACP|nr:MFS transporter [Staphylococcus capitis]MCC9117450.1 MFS transporter [Staphylococcus capitis]MCC9142515.1 MFS transporter [Staphylococcus capitis]MDS4004292.1 MFS transporter [Staphylococcus capitis]MDZ5507249.1 MFS transporter [Staphylococcus capitis]TBW76062.1 MFS transporter [Staphylococcus capitis]
MEIVKNKNDLFRIIDHADQKHTSKILLFMILGTIFLDAYDITILGTMTDQLTKEFHLSPTMLSVVMTSLPIGALFGAILGGSLAYKFGRKRILSVSLLILVITSLGAALAPHLAILLICRFIMGFAIGMDSPVAFTFIAEISNKWQKGRNVNYWQVVWYVAIVASALVVIAFFLMGTGEHLWRFAVGFGALIALVLYILRINYLKESPTWMINHHSLKEAIEYVRNNYDVDLKLEDTGESFSENKSSKSSGTEIFKPKYLKRIVLATAISTLQGMQYYGVGLYIPIIATYIISKDKLGVLLGTAIVNIAGIIGAYVGSQLTYKVGTRRLTMIGFSLVLIAMVMTGLFYHSLPMIINTFLIALFLFGHSGGPGTQGKTIAALSFPTYLRSQATGFVESVSRTGSIIGTFVFPIILAAVGLTNTMLILAIVPLVGLIITTALRWEAVGKNVEDE